MAAPPLSYQASDASSSRPIVSPSLPPEVATCVKNARFLHLATSSPTATPNVSLMNYTYLPQTPYHSTPTIIMTTNPQSRKTKNISSNAQVSLLVHDWVSHRPPTRHDTAREGSPPPAATRSSLATLLLQMNTSAMSRISATINGEARLLEVGSEEERWCREEHLRCNSFEDDPQAMGAGVGNGAFGTSPGEARGSAGGYLEGEEVRVVVVRIRDGRISDWKGGVTDWVIGDADEDSSAASASTAAPLTNGV